MKATLSAKLFVWFVLVTLLWGSFVWFVGCNSIGSIGATGSYNDGTWTVGIQITFKSPPTPATVTALTEAQAIRIETKPQVWIIGRTRSSSKALNKAIQLSIRDGAIIARLE